MTTYSFSPSMGCFLLNANQETYMKNNNWPDDAVEIDDEMAVIFVTTPPAGKRLGSAGNLPAWVDVAV